MEREELLHREKVICDLNSDSVGLVVGFVGWEFLTWPSVHSTEVNVRGAANWQSTPATKG